MRNRPLILFIFFFASVFCCEGQNRNSIWCFGDSAGIDFKTNPPSTFISAVKSRGSCASICDTSGNLLFYGFTRAGLSGNSTLVFNAMNSLMQNGDNVVGEGWYMEITIIPDPGDVNKYYLFTIGVTGGSGNPGLYYSIIDMAQDSGRGGVIQKNVPLINNKAVDCITAIKHANGRDWWILFRTWNITNNVYYKYLVAPSGITNPFNQNVGSPTNNGFLRMKCNYSGNQLAVCDNRGLVETLDFDRCTGLLTNYRLINPEPTSNFNQFDDAEFSPSSRYLYLSVYGFQKPSILIQADLQDTLPAMTWDTIYTNNLQSEAGGLLKFAPDGKIYWSCAWNDSIHFNYPYPDTVYNMFNSYLSVINQPDSAGTACDFQPYSFYLGGARTYWGLPNNPNYELGPLVGSPCDTLSVGINEIKSAIKPELFVYYHPQWQTAFINAKSLQGKHYALHVYDLMGNLIFKEEGKASTSLSMTSGGYFTKDINMQGFASGVYVVSLVTDREVLNGKFVKPF